MRFKAAAEKESNCSLKILRSDNGGEFTSHKFEEYLVKEGIKHQLTIPYTPQQNGVSERKNRTLMEMARCLLYEKKLPLKFWVEAVSTATYLLNRMMTRSLGDKTPYEEWHGHKPSIDHLKVFGSPCYVLQPEIKRRKLDQKSEVGILIGYSSKSKGYKVFDLKTNQAIIARNVKVAENQIWNWDEKKIEDTNNEHAPETDEESETDDEDQSVRGTRSLSDIYDRCNVAEIEPSMLEK